jgi:hypothetical protein
MEKVITSAPNAYTIDLLLEEAKTGVAQHPDTLGLDAVLLDERAIKKEMQHRAAVNVLEQVETAKQQKRDPRRHFDPIGVKKALSRAGVGKPFMTKLEAAKNDNLYFDNMFYAESGKRLAEVDRRKVHEMLDVIRHTLQSSTGWQRTDTIEAILESLPEHMMVQWDKSRHDGGQDLVDWLCIKRGHDVGGDTIQDADDIRLLNVLQYHNHRVAVRQQDPEFIDKVGAEKTKWALHVKQGVAEGWLDDSALERANGVDGIKVYEGDAFSTILRHAGGYHRRGSDNIVLEPNMLENTAHELNHALLQGPDAYSPKSIFSLMFVREAITEHIAQIMDSGIRYVESIDTSTGAYCQERSLIQSILYAAAETGTDLHATDFTVAYSASGAKAQMLSEEISSKVDSVFSRQNVLVDLQERIKKYYFDEDFMPNSDDILRYEHAVMCAIEMVYKWMGQIRLSALVETA